jgi:cytochrome P450
LIQTPAAFQQVLTQDLGKVFSAPGEVNSVLASILGNNSSLILSGEAHRRRRQLVTPPFYGERLKSIRQLILKISEDVMAEPPIGTSFSVRNLMQRLTMRVIMEVVFGISQGERYLALETLLHQRLDLVGTPLRSFALFLPCLQKDWGSWSPGHQARKLSAEIDHLLYAEIGERRQIDYQNRTDILSLLMAATDEKGEFLTDEELRDELITLLFAGHETTATALTWAFYLLHRHPEVLAQLRQEIATLPTPWTAADITQLPYLEAVCHEVLRVRPVAMLTFPRRVEQPINFQGYDLNPGDYVLGSVFLLHQRPDLYPDPQCFKPDRFLSRQYSAFEFLPFGAGARRCVGSALAIYEMKLALASAVSRWEFVLETQKELKLQRRGVTLSPNGEVRLRKVAERSSVASQS